jgi:uncharacterized protein (TIGR00297 family)
MTAPDRLKAWLRAVLLAGGVAMGAYRLRALTLDGAFVAAGMGAIVLLRGGVPAAASLLAFFTSSSALSLLGKQRKASTPLAQAKGARRDAWQVLANGGWATLSIALGRRTAFVGALAAAGADTWATELGMLARRQPRLITTLRRVPAGTSGGVTPEGLAASLGGALLVGLTWSLLSGNRRESEMVVAAVGGMGGSVLDSLLGATVQALYRCPRCGVETEDSHHRACGRATVLLRGKRCITNDAVNAVATLAGAIIGAQSARVPDAAGHVRGGS